ncbi:hypothetical protein McanMca71_002293 [Microsporum canis]|uniref:Uncharacterized protein n=1 Tax=Arthroderma otae (strain ATCC MYA-4605 / CBS 113480) TaxID=554155 RepID=C5FL28_ARTOC|nr:uncharacterized protein MCYG_03219 [Microsporum canis CBS 113480]EEQ30400.1 predicted protein [Microsporum canis CBS 113480]
MCFGSSDDDNSQTPPRPRQTHPQDTQPQRRHGDTGAVTAPIALRPMRPMMTPGNIPPNDVPAFARSIDFHLRGLGYAFIGGVACSLLGSQRTTHDLDIIVPQGARRQALSILARDSTNFGVAEGGSWVNMNRRRYNLDVIEPQQIGQQFTGREVVISNGVRVLDPNLLLQYKRYSLSRRDRSRVSSIENDKSDIKFLTQYLKNHR